MFTESPDQNSQTIAFYPELDTDVNKYKICFNCCQRVSELLCCAVCHLTYFCTYGCLNDVSENCDEEIMQCGICGYINEALEPPQSHDEDTDDKGKDRSFKKHDKKQTAKEKGDRRKLDADIKEKDYKTSPSVKDKKLEKKSKEEDKESEKASKKEKQRKLEEKDKESEDKSKKEKSAKSKEKETRKGLKREKTKKESKEEKSRRKSKEPKKKSTDKKIELQKKSKKEDATTEGKEKYLDREKKIEHDKEKQPKTYEKQDKIKKISLESGDEVSTYKRTSRFASKQLVEELLRVLLSKAGLSLDFLLPYVVLKDGCLYYKLYGEKPSYLENYSFN